MSVQVVEQMEEFFLAFFLVREELDIIHDEYVILAVLFFKLRNAAILHCRHKILREFLRAYVKNTLARPRRFDVVSYRLEEVRFAVSRGTVDKEGVVGYPGGFQDCLRSGVSE